MLQRWTLRSMNEMELIIFRFHEFHVNSVLSSSRLNGGSCLRGVLTMTPKIQ